MINARLLQRMVDASQDGIVVAEQEGEDNILIYVNDAFEALTGYSRDDNGNTWAVVAILNDSRPWGASSVLDQVLLDLYRQPKAVAAAPVL